MGRGSYTASDWSRLKNSRNITSDASASQIFQKHSVDERFDPRFVNVRESCDSEDSPEATPVIIGFDVTGSMGYLAEELAKNSLNATVTNLLEKQPVTNPHILCAAIGDSKSDMGPLQVTQFEADIRIAEQLLDLWLEGRDGGNGGESYHLLWYFAAQHTRTDCFEKRGKKGFLFTIGDEPCHMELTKDEIKRVFDDDVEQEVYSSQDLFAMASEKYEVFHIFLDRYPERSREVLINWDKIVGHRYVVLKPDDVEYIPQLITTIMQMVNGMDKNKALDQWDEAAKAVVSQAIAAIDLKPGKKFLFF